jgi:predicted RNase H-like HicB family nuclease
MVIVSPLGFRKAINMQLRAILSRAPEGKFIAVDPETGTTCQGDSADAVLDNLQMAVKRTLETLELIQTRKAAMQ